MSGDYEHFQKALAKRLKQLRKDRGFSLRDMTVFHGYAESQWRRMEREGVGSTLSLLRVAKAFQTTVADLIEGIGQYPKAAPKVSGRKRVDNAAPAQIATWAENATALKDRNHPEAPNERDTQVPALRKPKVGG